MEGTSFTRKVPQIRTFHLKALWSFVLRMFAGLWKGIQFQELVFVIVILLLLLRSEKIIFATSYPGENDSTISKAHYRFVRDYVDRLGLGVDSHWTSEASLVVWLNACYRLQFICA